MTEEKANSSKTKFKPGTILNGKYELEAFVGRGGTGEVWRAWDRFGARRVALKFVRPDKKKLDDEVRRMQDAFRVVVELNCRHVCPSYGLEFDKKRGLYLAMKWLDGSALNEVVAYNKDRLRKRGVCPRFPRCVIPEILKPTAAALDNARSRGVVHGDVKPSNVFLEIIEGKLCDVCLTDFGLASLVRGDVDYETGGSIPNAPSELWTKGKDDQFSLAVVAYELYAGKLPFFSANVGALRYSILYDAPPPIKGLPDELNKVLAKGLSKATNGRYESCSEFVAAVESATKGIDFDDEDRAALYPPPKRRCVVEKEQESGGDCNWIRLFLYRFFNAKDG